MASEKIRAAFASDQGLALRVANAYVRCQSDPELSQIFIDIAAHLEQLSQSRSLPTRDLSTNETQSKKRKLDTNEATQFKEVTTCFECRDVSFTIPARKKLKLELQKNTSDSKKARIRLVDTRNDTVEYMLSVDDIEQAFCLPVPDKAQRQQNYIIIPKDSPGAEQIAFTVNDAPDKVGTIGARTSDASAGETLVEVTTKEMISFLSQSGKKLAMPNEKEFASSIPQAHRKGEKAYHVKAFRGSKDGYLFFLSTGILFGFKKPVLFYPFGRIESISYTSVLQRTFNLVITPLSEVENAQDVEFSMIDQADFAGIDEYVKGHGLNDASMAADRRAKMYNVNKATKDEVANGDIENGEDGHTELEKAEQQLQDEEDELEEDYDPSGGESDGEGADSDEEEAYEQDEGYDDGDDAEVAEDK